MTAHVDTFARDHLPPRELWPVMSRDALPALRYPARVNAAAELLDSHLARGGAAGDRTAIVFPGGKWTYRQLVETSNRIARVLGEDLGVVPGNRVLLRAPNTPMLAACWLAVLKAGGICVTTMPLLRARELAYVAEKAQVRLALTDARLVGELEQARLAAPVLERIVAFGPEAGGPDALETRMGAKTADFQPVRTAADDVAMIAFTSGTTGQAKGTMHTHSDILAACDCFPPQVLHATPADLFCGSPPLAFTYGLGGLLLFPLRIGASTLLLEQATPPYLLQGIHDFKATVCSTAPTAYRAMTPLVKDFDLSSLSKCVSAGETLPLATWERWREVTGLRIIDGIGSTEMLHIFISSSGGDIRPGATGKVVPGYEACILDEDGRPRPAGEMGRLAVRGPTGCRYLDNLERQRAYVQHGWNLTGDTYRMDEDGYFWYQARSDDMIISAGYKISGPEVENALLDHPGVQECGVVGVPDEERGHIVKAFVVLRPGFTAGDETARQLQDFAKRIIAPYKYPRAIEFVEKLPRTDTGKLQRYRLRADSDADPGSGEQKGGRRE
jgi:2-aminobenzoate-CoA ligase